MMVFVSCENRTNDVDNDVSNNAVESPATSSYVPEASTVPTPVPPPIDPNIPDYITIQGRQFGTELTHLSLMRWDVENDDIIPLRYMVNLTSLDLNHNPMISDLSPLEGLTNLTTLKLLDNTSTDLTPLAGLTNLTELELSLRYFYDTDITPLVGLTGLTSFRLSLGANQISDISRLAELTTLTRLDLWHNQINDITPLAGLTNLRSLDVTFNEIYDITPLANLTNLNTLLLHYQPSMDLSLLYNIPPQVSSPTVLNPSNNPHPFAEALTDFFDNLTVAAEERFLGMPPYSYHAMLVDVDGQGTLGMVASRWTFERGREYPFAAGDFIGRHPNFSQRLFIMYGDELHEIDGHQWGVTPTGRLVAVMRTGACDMLLTDHILLDVNDGQLVGVKSISIFEQTWGDNYYHINHHINEFFWSDFEQRQDLTHEEFNELMNRYGLYGTTTNLWTLSDDTYKILEMSSN